MTENIEWNVGIFYSVINRSLRLWLRSLNANIGQHIVCVYGSFSRNFVDIRYLNTISLISYVVCDSCICVFRHYIELKYCYLFDFMWSSAHVLQYYTHHVKLKWCTVSVDHIQWASTINQNNQRLELSSIMIVCKEA